MHRDPSRKKISNMTAENRLETAKNKMNRMTEEFVGLLDLHANNAIITYSSKLAGQIPRSLAANSFNCIQRCLHFYEIIWICKFWDGVDFDKDNIPTVVELVKDDKVQYLIDQAVKSALGQRAASRTSEGLRKAIELVQNIADSPEFDAIKNLRDKSSHILTTTTSERKKGITHAMRYGDEKKLINDTKAIIEALNLSITGNFVEVESSFEIAKENAEALWNNCKFNIVL